MKLTLLFIITFVMKWTIKDNVYTCYELCFMLLSIDFFYCTSLFGCISFLQNIKYDRSMPIFLLGKTKFNNNTVKIFMAQFQNMPSFSVKKKIQQTKGNVYLSLIHATDISVFALLT